MVALCTDFSMAYIFSNQLEILQVFGLAFSGRYQNPYMIVVSVVFVVAWSSSRFLWTFTGMFPLYPLTTSLVLKTSIAVAHRSNCG